MSRKGEFIAQEKDTEEIRQEIGADYLIYQTVDEMIKSALSGNKNIKNFCAACFTKNYPTGDITDETYSEFQQDRDDATETNNSK
jgi:amidophosphoribosyltransferase